MDTALSLATAYAWPLTVLVLAIIFEPEIRGLLRRLRSADLSSRVFHFGDAPFDRAEAPKPAPRRKRAKTKPGPPTKWDKPATIFWLANDLMWIQDMLFRGAPPSRIVPGLKHARDYVTALNLTDSFAVQELTRVIEYFEGGPHNRPMPLVDDAVPQLANRLELVKRDVASRLEEAKPGFTKFRAL